uniref:Uncharacterized protein n=1 Tax=Rhizophora mucronata TaxID=61149 RepID=A0A2P2Q184_RHIMU
MRNNNCFGSLIVALPVGMRIVVGDRS